MPSGVIYGIFWGPCSEAHKRPVTSRGPSREGKGPAETVERFTAPSPPLNGPSQSPSAPQESR